MHSPNCSMYNDMMLADSYEIRVCNSCGLRYPLADAHTFGIRCPACLGKTRIALSQRLTVEPARDRHSNSLTPNPSLRNAAQSPERREELAVLLDNIRSAWNVGSILRSADGFGIAHAYLCGLTPTPDNETVQKTALGAEESVTWSYHKDAVKLVKGLKKEGWKLSALEEDKRAIAISVAASAQPSAQREVLIVGNEVTGVDPELLDRCDMIYYIPMHGQKRSFNVAIAFGIAAYALK
jgi:23S rRNA (guanosine2251-2'-O)-methyltransferase